MSGITYTTTCQFCPKTFHHSKFEEMFDGATLKSAGGKLLQDFSRHLFEQHQAEWIQHVTAPASGLSTMLLLKCFTKSQDKSIAERVEWMRHQIHTFTGFSMPDEKLQARVIELGLNPEDCAKVFVLVKTIRDILLELPPFSPKEPGAKVEPLADRPLLVQP